MVFSPPQLFRIRLHIRRGGGGGGRSGGVGYPPPPPPPAVYGHIPMLPWGRQPPSDCQGSQPWLFLGHWGCLRNAVPAGRGVCPQDMPPQDWVCLDTQLLPSCISVFFLTDAFNGKPQHPLHNFEEALLFGSSRTVLPLVLYSTLTVHPEVCWCAVQKSDFFLF